MNTKYLFNRLNGTLLAMTLLVMPMIAISAENVATTMVNDLAMAIDLVDERPTFTEEIWNYSTFPVRWTWGFLQNNVLSFLAVPSPASLMKSVSKKDASLLFKMLSDAGYKLKVISVDVGIIPSLYFKFVQAREMSEADYEYLETQLANWERSSPGIYSGIQRRIIKTIMAVNLNSEYKVATLTVKLLPLPDVAFEMMQGGVTDFVATLNAINRVGRSVREAAHLKDDNTTEIKN